MVKNKYLILCLILLVLPVVFANVLYEVDMVYENGNVKIVNKDVVYSRSSAVNFFVDRNDSTNYRIELVDNLGDVVHVEWFSLPLENIRHFGDSGNFTGKEVVILERLEFSIEIPYFDGVTDFIIYDNDNTVVDTLGVKEFARIHSGDEVIDIVNKLEGISEDSMFFLYLVVFIFFIILIYFVLYLKFRRK